MPKVTLPPIGNPENSSFVTQLNDALDVLADEFDKVLYRDGSYNLTNPASGLDANSKPIYNLRAPVLPTEPVRYGDVSNFQGTPGDDAPLPNWDFVIVTGAPGTDADLDVTGTYPNQTLTFTVPRGTPGASGALSDGDMGDIIVSGSGATLTIDNNVVTFAKLQDIGDGVIGRTFGGSGDASLVTWATAKLALGLSAADVGLGNVNNTSDANKPVSTAQATAIAAARLLPNTDEMSNFTATGTEKSHRYRGAGGTCTVDNAPALNSLITVYNDGSGNLAISASGVTIINLSDGTDDAFSIPPQSAVNLHKVENARWLASPTRMV